MNKTQNQLWGDWRAMTHEHQEANYAMLATIRARALNTLDKMAPEQQTLALQYALDLWNLPWQPIDLERYWRGEIVPGERLGHIKVGMPEDQVRARLFDPIQVDVRHGLDMWISGPFWISIDHKTRCADQILVNANANYTVTGMGLALGMPFSSIEATFFCDFNDDVWELEDIHGLCFGEDDDDDDFDEDFDDEDFDEDDEDKIIEWIAVHNNGADVYDEEA